MFPKLNIHFVCYKKYGLLVITITERSFPGERKPGGYIKCAPTTSFNGAEARCACAHGRVRVRAGEAAVVDRPDFWQAQLSECARV